MASSTLKFGPEWLRNLSDGSGSAAPSSSSTSSSLHGSSSHGTIPVPKYKLAEFRYGREEMLGLFCPPVAVPEELKDFKAILSDRQLQPLALQVEADDEQHLFSQPVNSTAVIRLTNRGVSTPLCLREVDRGRGRGRGRAEGRGFYSRVPNEEESFPRGRHPKDGNDTDSRGRGFGNTGRSFDDMSTFSSSHAEFSRSMSTDNWRDSRKYEDSKGNWRDLNQRPTTRRWKEPWEKGFDGSRDRATDRRMSEDGCHDRPVSAYRRSTSSNFAYEEESDPLPEWSTDDSEDIGTFDSSGAFMSLRELEQQEKKDKDGHLVESWQDKEDELEKNNLEFEKDRTTEELGDVDDKQCNITFELKDEGGLPLQQPLESASDGDLAIDSNIATEAEDTNKDAVTVDNDALLVLSSNGNVMASATEEKADNKEVVMESLGLVDVSSSNCQMEQHDAEVNFDHLELQVEHLYASIISADEENVGNVEKEKGFLPLDHEDAKKWFYRDPQGQVQGPFSAVEMAEWFSAGYFSPNLVVKQGSDDCFVPLGELIKKMGSVPFISAPLKIPPNVVNTATDLQQMQPDPLKLLLLQQQQQQKQQQQQQQQQQALPQQLQQQLRNPQEPFSKMSPAQQQQLLLQLILKQHLNPQMATPTSQQQRPTKTSAINRPSPLDALNVNPFGQLSTASSLPSNNTASSFHRSMSQSAAIEASALPSSLLFGLPTTTAAAASATNLPKGGAPSASALWRSSSCAPSASNPSWMPDSGASLGSWNQEPKSITAAELEEFQYQALEKAQQQQSTQPLSNLRDPRLLLQELVAHAAAEKRRDVNGTGALVSIDQLRELLQQQQQQQKQQTDIVRLAEEQRRLLEMNPRLLRQDRSDDLYCKQQLENLCRLQNDSLTSSMQERDALVVRQLLSLQSAQSWAATQNRTQMTGGLPSSILSSSLFQHKDNGSSSSPSIVQQELLNKHLKLNEMKTALNQWPIGTGSSSHWTGETGTWAAALPSKSPVQWDATTAVNNKTINSMIPFVPGGGGGGSGLPTQVKQEFIQKLAKSKEELMLWCENVLKSMLTCSSMDIPTFIHHLMDLTSPAEVNQFVQMYLGDTDDAKKFVKQFVEKHSRMQFIQKKALLMHLSSGSQW